MKKENVRFWLEVLKIIITALCGFLGGSATASAIELFYLGYYV